MWTEDEEKNVCDVFSPPFLPLSFFPDTQTFLSSLWEDFLRNSIHRDCEAIVSITQMLLCRVLYIKTECTLTIGIVIEVNNGGGGSRTWSKSRL